MLVLLPELLVEKKRKEKTSPFGVDLTRSLVIYQAAQMSCLCFKLPSTAACISRQSFGIGIGGHVAALLGQVM